MNSKPIAVGLLFGVGMALALKSWLLGIMFGIIFYVAINETEKKKLTKWNMADELVILKNNDLIYIKSLDREIFNDRGYHWGGKDINIPIIDKKRIILFFFIVDFRFNLSWIHNNKWGLYNYFQYKFML